MLPFADQIAFDIVAADEPMKFILTRIRDRGFQQLPNTLSVSIEFLTNTRTFVSIDFPSRLGSKMMMAWIVFAPVVWSSFAIFVVLPEMPSNDVSIIPLVLMMVIFLPLWFWWGMFTRRRSCEKLATYFAHAAYHRIHSTT